MEKPLPVSITNVQSLSITTDDVRGTYWINTEQEIFEVVVTEEARNVWEIFLERKQFDSALEYSQVGGGGVADEFY